MQVQLNGALQFQSVSPLLLLTISTWVVWITSVKSEKAMLLIENLSDIGYVLFSAFYNAINNAYLLYRYNCKLFDMPPKEL